MNKYEYMLLNNYLLKRNKQIAEMKFQGKTWREISKITGLSRQYVKTIGHTYGVSGTYT